jgi:two-component system, OmpR family, response regulator
VSSHIPASTFVSKRLLVIEDDRSIAELLRIWFQPHGWNVATALNGIQGLVQVSRFRPDVVLLDVMLPGLGGLDVLRQIRLQDAALPVILCTARDSEEERAAGLAAGANDYFVKPWSLARLENSIRELMRMSPGARSS